MIQKFWKVYAAWLDVWKLQKCTFYCSNHKLFKVALSKWLKIFFLHFSDSCFIRWLLFYNVFEKTFTKNKFPEVVSFSKSSDELPLVLCTHTLFRLRSITFHFEFFWCLMYSVLCLKRDLSVIICKRTTHGVFSALTIRKMSNVTFGAASGIFFFLRKNQTKSTRRPIWFHILRIFFFSAFWSCLGVYQHLRNFGSATSYLTQKMCTPCIDAGDITSWMSLLQRCFPFFRSTRTSAS